MSYGDVSGSPQSGPYSVGPGATVPVWGPPPVKRRRRWPWILAACLAAIIAGLVVLAVLFGRSGQDNPRDAVQKFWAAFAAHNLDQAEKYVCPSKNVLHSDSLKQAVDEVRGYTIGSSEGSGNSRVFHVSVQISASGQTETVAVDTTVKKDVGKWYVCGIDAH